MKAREKAIELQGRFFPHVEVWDCTSDMPVEENHAKACALICVEEIIDFVGAMRKNGESCKYWQEVKQEILDQNKEDE